jgi:hypothetical protein
MEKINGKFRVTKTSAEKFDGVLFVQNQTKPIELNEKKDETENNKNDRENGDSFFV